MLEAQNTFEWQVGDGEDWGRFESPEDVLVAAAESIRMGTWRRRLARVVVTAGVALLLVTAAAGYYFWQEYQAGIARIRTDIQGSIDLEAWSWQTADEELLNALIDQQASEGWREDFLRVQRWRRAWAGEAAGRPAAEIRNMELRGDVALAEVVVSQPGEPWATEPYRESRFYRQIDGRWLRTAPDASFWGAAQTIETAHFRFEFRRRDTLAVVALATEIDAIYAALRRSVGLEEPPADERLTIAVLPRTDVMDWRFTGDSLAVSSPSLEPVPVELPTAARLTQSVVRPLARRVVDRVLRQQQVKSDWQPMADGLYHWLAWETATIPSAWRYYVEGMLRQRLADGRPMRLTDLTTRWIERSTLWSRIVAAASVVDYATATYGRDRLPALVGGLGEHESWETLIPAVFDVSPEEFEAGWQAYLTAHFAPPDDIDTAYD